MVSEQWFVRMEPLARPALAAVASHEITILPERFEKIYNNWLENIKVGRCRLLRICMNVQPDLLYSIETGIWTLDLGHLGTQKVLLPCLSGLVHQPTAVVGAPDPRVVCPRQRGGCRCGGGRGRQSAVHGCEERAGGIENGPRKVWTGMAVVMQCPDISPTSHWKCPLTLFTLFTLPSPGCRLEAGGGCPRHLVLLWSLAIQYPRVAQHAG